MRAEPSSSRIITGRLHRLATAATVLFLVSGCAGADRSPSPGDSTSTPAIVVSPSPVSTPTPSSAPTGTPAVAAGLWEGAGNIKWPRYAPKAVLLGDGRVLLLGDEGGKYEPVPEHSQFAELWDPATGTWRETEYLQKARGQFAAVTLLDGRALVAGGMNAAFESYSSAYVFDPASETWMKVGLMGTARAAPAAAVLLDGRVLVAGGGYYTGMPAEGAGGNATLAAWHTATGPAQADGGIRVADAGPDPIGYALATAELFDPRTGTWSATGPMRYARFNPTAVTLGDGRVLVGGGAAYPHISFEIYDPATGRFSVTDALPGVDPSDLAGLGLPSAGADTASPDWGGALVALADGDALLANTNWYCRFDPASEEEIRLTRTFRFEAAVDRWTEVGAPQVSVSHSTADVTTWEDLGEHHPDGIVAQLRDGRVLFAGGQGLDQLGTRAAEMLDPGTGTWSPLPDMPGARVRAEMVALADGSMLIAGGYSNGGDGYPVALGRCVPVRAGPVTLARPLTPRCDRRSRTPGRGGGGPPA